MGSLFRLCQRSGRVIQSNGATAGGASQLRSRHWLCTGRHCGQELENDQDGRPKKVLIETGDALIWQTLASVIIPGYAINRICHHSQLYFKKHYRRFPILAINLMTVGVGLISIPFIVHPIDNGVTILMDLTYRRWFK
ncbi:PREDICTED: mitochondrial fission process protein 1 isoform X2 [Papilio polytes]|uniref:mitochondrial fission process protein 1 isoform X2 n=1 Tax=Papilio polytes TaxID=76194 RepID=UPI0006768B54|nr:PREDICTED: mitochondrial fission process protein 1 isoform X2 [Papilio polytes]